MDIAFFEGWGMLNDLWISKEKAQRDAQEVRGLKNQFGDEILSVLNNRAHDKRLAPRDRRHWKRILRRAQAGS